MTEAGSRDQELEVKNCACGRALWRRTDAQCAICESRANGNGSMNQARTGDKVSGVSLSCFGCGDLTRRRYRDLPLCLDCQREACVLNQIFDLPSEPPRPDEAIGAALDKPARRLSEFAAMAACVFMLWVLLYLTRDFWVEWARMWGLLK